MHANLAGQAKIIQFLINIYSCISGELVLAPSDTKIKYEENGGTGKSFTTAIICVNAKGDILPPLTVYAAKSVNRQWTEGGPARSTFQCSKKWLD